MTSLNVWADTIAERLYFREAQYRRAKHGQGADVDPDATRIEATMAATYALLELTQALGELPQFIGGVGLLPLQQLVMALGELPGGGRPDMLQPMPGVGLGKDGFYRRYVKKHAAAAVTLLIIAGNRTAGACAAVAKELSAAGVKGRKGGNLSAGTIQKWIVDVEEDAELRAQVAAVAVEWTSDPQRPPSETSILEWLRRAARSPAFQAKI